MKAKTSLQVTIRTERMPDEARDLWLELIEHDCGYKVSNHINNCKKAERIE